MFRRESPDDAGLTWMIEALRAGELSSHVGRVLERKEKKRKGRKTHTIERGGEKKELRLSFFWKR